MDHTTSSSTQSTMDIHEEFTKWATQRGVTINGIRAHQFDGRGLGIMAEKRLAVNATILTTPHSALRTIHSIPKNILAALNPTTVHNLLATELSLDASSRLAPWTAVLPSYSDFQQAMPLLYPDSLQALLPAASKALVCNQQRKLNIDWETASKAFPALDYETYLHNWLLVNTRTFYFLSPKHKGPSPPRDDCMALNPFADYFNHSSTPNCSVLFTNNSYKVVTESPIDQGEEIYISYGNHSNDFLLAEYGFILKENKHDVLSLDNYILPLFSLDQKEKLAEKGYWENYILDGNASCYRTQVALRILCMPVRRWIRFAGGLEDGEKEQKVVDAILFKVLQTYKRDAAEKLKQVTLITEGLPSQRDTLRRRWKQIDAMLSKGLENYR